MGCHILYEGFLILYEGCTAALWDTAASAYAIGYYMRCVRCTSLVQSDQISIWDVAKTAMACAVDMWAAITAV